jgi:hypothetical protein
VQNQARVQALNQAPQAPLAKRAVDNRLHGRKPLGLLQTDTLRIDQKNLSKIT